MNPRSYKESYTSTPPLKTRGERVSSLVAPMEKEMRTMHTRTKGSTWIGICIQVCTQFETRGHIPDELRKTVREKLFKRLLHRMRKEGAIARLTNGS